MAYWLLELGGLYQLCEWPWPWPEARQSVVAGGQESTPVVLTLLSGRRRKCRKKLRAGEYQKDFLNNSTSNGLGKTF